MSQIKVTANASGTGVVTVTSPNTNTNRSLLLPDASDTLVGQATADTLSNKTLASPAVTGTMSINSNNLSPFTLKNRIINGGMIVDQRNAGASQTFTAAAAIAYSVDRFYGSCTGANVTGQQTTGPTGFAKCYQFTGAASVTQILFGQRIESNNCYDLVNQNVVLSVNMSNSVLTTVTWTAYYANSADTFSSKTQIATGTWTVSSTATNYSATFNAGANAGNGIAIEFTVGAQTSGTWKITGVQLELGTVASPFEIKPIGMELALCQRYYQKWTAAWSGVAAGVSYNITSSTGFSVTMRATPTAGVTSQTNSARYPSSAYSVFNIYPYGITAVYAAQSAGGNENWYVDGTASIEL